MEIQKRLFNKEISLTKPYSYGFYNKSNKKEQWIRLSQGCINQCPYCYEPKELEVYEIPKIIRNNVKIMDMNLLCKKQALDIINELGKIYVNNKVVYYELICGLDYRFLTQKLANTLKSSRFINIRLAWDWFYKDQLKIRDSIKILEKSGYDPNKIMIFMICNWKIPYSENLKKMDLCKIWGVKIGDCYFDNQISPNIIPKYWTDKQIKDFRQKTRKHNQLVRFGIDPELKNHSRKMTIEYQIEKH